MALVARSSLHPPGANPATVLNFKLKKYYDNQLFIRQPAQKPAGAPQKPSHRVTHVQRSPSIGVRTEYHDLTYDLTHSYIPIS
eukprot:3963690-Pyramimonas_sp.AAC.1